MFLEIIRFFLHRFLLLAKIYIIKKTRSISRASVFLQMHYASHHDGKVYGHVSDLSHAFFVHINSYIMDHPWVLNLIMYMISISINTSLLILCDVMIHSIAGTNVIFIVMTLRSILQLVYRSSPPDGRSGPWFHKFNHWSLRSKSETFFSGHAATTTLSLLLCHDAEFILHYIPHNVINIIVIVNLIFMIAVLLILRIHYIIDIYSAIVTCVLCHNLIYA